MVGGKPVAFGTVDVRNPLSLRENSSELLKEFQLARKTSNSHFKTHELVSLRSVYAQIVYVYADRARPSRACRDEGKKETERKKKGEKRSRRTGSVKKESVAKWSECQRLIAKVCAN